MIGGYEQLAVAFILVNAELGSEEDVIREIRKLSDVKEAHLVYGMYDIMVKVEGPSVEEVKETVNSKIRKMDKIRSTLTMIAP
jgi:DNA-binding Lrp family transcriptional regulator